MRTQEQLGAVHLKIEGLDKGRFKKLVNNHSTVDDMGLEEVLYRGTVIIENYFSPRNRWVWACPDEVIESSSKLITLDELENLLNSKIERTSEVIEAEIKALQKELDELNNIYIGDFVLTKQGSIGMVIRIDSESKKYFVSGFWHPFDVIKKIDPNKTVKEIHDSIDISKLL